jgi:hypothetical protein
VIDPSSRLRYLVANDAFAVCGLLATSKFVEFCKERGVGASEEQLERFERLGILFPIARVSWPRVKHKIEFIEERTRYRDHGILREGETWDGDLQEEWGRWRLDGEGVVELLDEGHLWDPRSRPFEPWTNFRDESGETHTESFYSMFQCFPVEWKQMWLTGSIDTSIFVGLTERPAMFDQMISLGKETVAALQGLSREDEIAFVCQAVSARYFPLTQTDRRTFVLQERSHIWDWHEFIATWNATAIASAIGLTDKTLKDYHQTAGMIAKSRDPLEHWYQLVRFISVDKKKKLKGSAQFAQLLYATEYMLRMFAEEAFGSKLHPPDEGHTWKNSDFYGEGIPEDPLRHLEFVVNDYHLNPRPKLILVVEGPGEEVVIPRLAEQALGSSLPTLGIEVRSLGGVGEFTGRKKLDKLGALEKLIDDYHFRQTVVFVMLDREGRVETVTNKLLAARSKLYPSRMLTCPEYLHLWQRSIEFDNFSHGEIATALTTQCKSVYTFTAEEIADAERKYDQHAADPLSALYTEKVGHGLDKIGCLQALTDILIEAVRDLPYPDLIRARPVLQRIDQVLSLAGLNHQPVTHDSWKRNQESGYFGKVVDKRSDDSADTSG